MKTCARCRESKDLSMFGKDKATKSGLDCYCKVCKRQKGLEWKANNRIKYMEHQAAYRDKNRERLREYNKRYDKQNPKKVLNADLRAKYGLDLADYLTIEALQDYSCAICGIHKSKLTQRLAVDHCHVTGQVRGLLCGPCNRALGQFRDSLDLLNNASAYLKGER